MTDRKNWSLQEILELHRQATERNRVEWFSWVRDIALALLASIALFLLRFGLEAWLH